jgi:hypothetical protein
MLEETSHVKQLSIPKPLIRIGISHYKRISCFGKVQEDIHKTVKKCAIDDLMIILNT